MSVEHIEKTAPIKTLESRRKALIGWFSDGQDAIRKAEAEILKHKQQAIEMTDEIAEIEAALGVLYAAQQEAVNVD